MSQTNKQLTNKRFFQLVKLEDDLHSKSVMYLEFSKKLSGIKNIKRALSYKTKSDRCENIAMKVRNQIRKGNNGIF